MLVAFTTWMTHAARSGNPLDQFNRMSRATLRSPPRQAQALA
jgi:hypothetical protein